MKKSYFVILLICCFVIVASCSKNREEESRGDDSASTFVTSVADDYKKWMEIPVYEGDNDSKILRRKGYTTSYNRKTKQPDWVAWRLTKKHTYGDYRRDSLEFLEDREVERPRATLDDYFRSGYDRGHMCPSGDNKWDEEAQRQSFLLTNVCPQNHWLNKDEWNDLEIQCRRWARKYGQVYIICGPLFEGNDIKRIGKNKVYVPTGFFKVVLANDRNPKAVGYVFDNRSKSNGRACSVDEIEALTGMDFFSLLEDKVEDRIEAYAADELSDFYEKRYW